MSRRYDVYMAQSELKTTQYSLLSYVVRLGPIRPADLAQTMAMEPSTLIRNLKPLMEAGWVEMAAGVDARSRLVRATPEGQAKRAEAQRLWKLAQLSLNETLGTQRVQALHTLIQESLALLAYSHPEADANSGADDV